MKTLSNQENPFFKIKDDIGFVQREIEKFSLDNYQSIKELIEEVRINIESLFLMRIWMTEEKYKERCERYAEINKKIKEYNKELPRKTLIEYLQKNPEEFIDTKLSKIGHIKETDFFVKNKKDCIKNFIPKIEPRPQITIDPNYCEIVKEKLGEKKNILLDDLTISLENAKILFRDMFQDYTNAGELFTKLWITPKKVNYSFFTKENPIEKTEKSKTTEKKIWWEKETPTVKKVWFIMKYIKDNNIFVNPNNIVQDANWRYQIYLNQQDITILVSDEIVNNSFRDATYLVKWVIPWLRNMNKDEFKTQHGRRITFSDSWERRMECAFNEDANQWPILWPDSEECEKEEKILITDRAKFIGIIKENFDANNFNIESYYKFASKYNRDPSRKELLRLNVLSNASLLGLWSPKISEEDIKKAIFEGEKRSLAIPEGAYFSNEYTKKTLVDMKNCSQFDPEKVLWSQNYLDWTLLMLKQWFQAKTIDEIKNKSQKEKKEKLAEYTGIKWLPLFPAKITSMLGGRTRSMDEEYQKMLRKRFIMYIENNQKTEAYKTLEKEILEREILREDNSLRPREKIISHFSEEISDGTKEKEEQKIPNTKNEFITKSKSEILYELKNPIGFESFPPYEVRVGKVIEEKNDYRIIKAHNCVVEIRLYKSDAWTKYLSLGDKINVFATRKNPKENYIKVLIETRKGFAKVAKFKRNNDISINEFIPWKTYKSIIDKFSKDGVWLFINSWYCGRVPLPNSQSYKVGDIISVIYQWIYDKERVKLSLPL